MFFNKTGYTSLNENWELVSPKSSVSSGVDSASDQMNTVHGKQAASGRIRGRYIAASLYNRLLPRWHFCLSHTKQKKLSEKSVDAAVSATDPSSVALPMPSTSSPLPQETSPGLSPMTPPLHVLVMADDKAFCEVMGVEVERFLSFKKEAIPRLKFSSQFDTWLKTGKPIDL